MSKGDEPEPRITLAAVTAWRGDEAIRFDPTTLSPRRCTDPSLESLRGTPVWLDMDLEGTDACEWLEPWDRPKDMSVSWSSIEPVAEALGFRVPGAAPDGDPVAIGLERLVRLNEIGVLRWLGRRLGEQGNDYVAAPLLGTIPTSSIKGIPPSNEPLEIVLLRVNLLVLEGSALMFTIRLPDRLASGSAPDAEGERHRPASTRVPRAKRPNLTLFRRHLPPSGPHSAKDLGDALALYLTATCWSAAEHGRTALDTVEQRARRRAEGDDAEQAVAGIATEADRIVHLWAALQQTEAELTRVLQRLSEPEPDARLRTAGTARYERAIEQLRSVQRDVRTVMDSLTVRSAESQREVAKAREKRQEAAQAVLAGVGTVVIVPSLVAALYSDNAKLATDKVAGVAQARMLMLMAASVLVGFALVFATMRTGLGDIRTRLRAAGRPAVTMFVGGISVALAALLLSFV